jgi:hypothetical protein
MSAPPARGYLGISEVLAQLRPDFADISVSKIRFLETEGLIAPARSPSGYRRFSSQDVDRLRFILSAQRDQYLPLRVIRERLARLDQVAAGPAAPADGAAGPGRPAGPAWPSDPGWSAGPTWPDGPARRPGGPALPGGPARRPGGPAQPDGPARRPDGAARVGGQAVAGADREGPPPAGSAHGAAEPLLSRRELLEATGVSEALLTELETFGLLRRAGRYYSPDAAEVATTAAALTAFGVEARHLRAVRAAAERESTMIESLLAPILRQRGPGARELAGRTARECALLVLRLHAALVDGALAEAGLAGPGIQSTGLTPGSASTRGDATATATGDTAGHEAVSRRAGTVGGASA